jgi:hypothetical protein
MTKRFALSAADIKDVAPGRGSCIASDKITVEGKPVRFMYRDEPHGDTDSGWCFLSGEETQEYADDPANFGLYDVNTIANYDREIIDHLDAPAFSAFERQSGDEPFVPATFPG